LSPLRAAFFRHRAFETVDGPRGKSEAYRVISGDVFTLIFAGAFVRLLLVLECDLTFAAAKAPCRLKAQRIAARIKTRPERMTLPFRKFKSLPARPGPNQDPHNKNLSNGSQPELLGKG
jgi:hypothetical protein